MWFHAVQSTASLVCSESLLLWGNVDAVEETERKAPHSRSTAELNGGEGAGGAVGILQELLHGDADGHHSDWVWVGLIEDGAQALDGLGLSEGSVQGKHWLEMVKCGTGKVEVLVLSLKEDLKKKKNL